MTIVDKNCSCGVSAVIAHRAWLARPRGAFCCMCIDLTDHSRLVSLCLNRELECMFGLGKSPFCRRLLSKCRSAHGALPHGSDFYGKNLEDCSNGIFLVKSIDVSSPLILISPVSQRCETTQSTKFVDIVQLPPRLAVSLF